MTIQEAQQAARSNAPVIHEDPMEGPILYARIKSIRKDYALRSDVQRGAEAESYALELVSMHGARSSVSCSPDRVRIATAAEIADLKHYQTEEKRPEVHPELICEELRGKRGGAT